jgi:aerobic-type carbon monoxide dehydrogenase small subunit (CoxS/CutS family)
MSKKTQAGKSTPSANRGRSHAGASAGSDKGLTRRGFLGSSAAAGGVALAGRKVQAAQPKTIAAKKTALALNVNGKSRTVKVEPRITLLRALRNELDVTGPKEICDRGACGGCSVQVDGKLVNACMMLAVDAVGKKITTVEGLAQNGKLHPLQSEFVKHDALQCGFCTPGMLMACKAILDSNKSPDLVTIKKGLRGNICRCGTYTRIFAAVQAASKQV